MTDCIFCKIIQKQLPADVVYEDEQVLVIRDINPKAPVHLLVVAKKHIPSVRELKLNDGQLIAHMVLTGQDIAVAQNLVGYKLVYNVGREGGQVIDHLHLHVLGGWEQETHKVEV